MILPEPGQCRQDGQALLPLVSAEPRQREFAFRAGVNIVMYTLTGNYKADQVHVPALLGSGWANSWPMRSGTTIMLRHPADLATEAE